ncbi:MAG: arginine--tRNA ligase [Puniceicoccales bacterium]|jgi:arginyl-tRNA synthetase|nr:arginine--tRNA ligase [Puniceicoccales bacterium]
MEIWFNPARELDALLRKAAAQTPLFGDAPFAPEIRPADPRFGDFQANGVLAHAKALKANPRALATALVETLKNSGALDSALDDTLVTTGIAGPGFINFALTPKFLDAWLERYADADAFRAGASALYAGKRVVIDYPSANTAKQMHVGHLRPIVIGEAIARLLQFCGADLVRDNHIGDWGTNFGTLIYAIKRAGADATNLGLEDLEGLYKEGSALTKADPAALDAARAELVKLQAGDPENTRLWETIVAVSNAAFQEMYDLLGVKPDVTLGESFYRDKVGRVYQELTDAGLAEESDGALVVWHDEHPRFARSAEPSQPFIIRKKDGASNYGSTDLATILYRSEHFHADECIYVTDGRQQDHFQQLFLTAEKWFAAMRAKGEGRKLPVLRHVWFGAILGDDGRAIKTKSGNPVRLKALLDEATARAAAIIAEKNPSLPEDERACIAQTVGIGAIRYADLSQNRTLDYTFSWQKLLTFEGNTAPYLLYAVARIHSIFRKAGVTPEVSGLLPPAPLETETEIALARKLLTFPAALEQACAELRPHFLCTCLFELAGAYSTFNNADKVLVDDLAVRSRRLRLCARTATALTIGLRLLGIEPLLRM